MTAIEYANTMTNPKGIKPFGPISVRWNRARRDWCATNTIDKGWDSCVHIHAKRLADVLARLNVDVVGIRCDDASMYYLCEPSKN